MAYFHSKRCDDRKMKKMKMKEKLVTKCEGIWKRILIVQYDFVEYNFMVK